MNMKMKFKVMGTAFKKGSDQLVSDNFVGYTWAPSVERAIRNIEWRENITLRDVRYEIQDRKQVLSEQVVLTMDNLGMSQEDMPSAERAVSQIEEEDKILFNEIETVLNSIESAVSDLEASQEDEDLAQPQDLLEDLQTEKEKKGEKKMETVRIFITGDIFDVTKNARDIEIGRRIRKGILALLDRYKRVVVSIVPLGGVSLIAGLTAKKLALEGKNVYIKLVMPTLTWFNRIPYQVRRQYPDIIIYGDINILKDAPQGYEIKHAAKVAIQDADIVVVYGNQPIPKAACRIAKAANKRLIRRDI